MRIVRGNLPQDEFTIIANTPLRDAGLSLRAKGLLAWLVSHQVGWSTSSDRIAESCVESVGQVKAALKDLEDAGYITRERYRDAAGRWAWQLCITDSHRERVPIAGSTDDGAPLPDRPSRGKRPDNKKTTEEDQGTTRLVGETSWSDAHQDQAPYGGDVGVQAALDVVVPVQALPAPRRSPSPLWEAVMEVCGVTSVPDAARGAYGKAVKDLSGLGVHPEEIPARAAVFRGRWPSASLTPTALARRWGECDPERWRQYAPATTREVGTMAALAEARARHR